MTPSDTLKWTSCAVATLIAAAAAIPFERVLGGQAERLATLKQDVVSRGIRRVHRDHPETVVVTAAVDPVLNGKGYIVPGLGDAGDRLYAT